MNFFNKKTKKVKSVCDCCKKTSYYTRGDIIKKDFLMLLLFFGILAVMVTLIVGPSNMLAGVSSGFMFKMAGYQSDFDARGYALNHTTLDGRDSFVFAEELVANMPRVRYVPASFFNPIPKYEDIVAYGADCKGVATFFSKLMQESGYQARIDCSFKHSHCVNRIYYDGNDKAMKNSYMIVDLTRDYVAIFDNDKSFWDGDKPYMARTYTK